jgi:hypothetical protein
VLGYRILDHAQKLLTLTNSSNTKLLKQLHCNIEQGGKQQIQNYIQKEEALYTNTVEKYQRGSLNLHIIPAKRL